MEIGDRVVVQLGERELLGRVSRVTAAGAEVTFTLPLPAAVLGSAPGKLTWPDGREDLFSPGRAAVTATVTLPISDSKQNLDRRATFRLKRFVAVDVDLERPDGPLHLATGSSRDLSMDGARLRLDRGLKVGEAVRVTLHLEDEAVTLDAGVTRHRRLADGGHEVGVHFENPQGEAKALLARFIFSRLRTSRGTAALNPAIRDDSAEA